MRMCTLAAVAAFCLASPALACDEETIDAVSRGGQIITLEDGSVYRVNSYDQSTASSWSSGDDVLVCDDEKIINTDDGEAVEVTKIR